MQTGNSVGCLPRLELIHLLVESRYGPPDRRTGPRCRRHLNPLIVGERPASLLQSSSVRFSNKIAELDVIKYIAGAVLLLS